MNRRRRGWLNMGNARIVATLLTTLLCGLVCPAAVRELRPATAGTREEFEDVANFLKPATSWCCVAARTRRPAVG